MAKRTAFKTDVIIDNTGSVAALPHNHYAGPAYPVYIEIMLLRQSQDEWAGL